MVDRPRIRVQPLALAEAGLSTGAAEYAGAIAVSLEPGDVVLAPAPTPPSPEVVREAIRPRRPPPLLAGPVGAAALLAPHPTPRRRQRAVVHATPHGVAAALKAEAPQAPHGPDAAPVTWRHVIQRSNRKDANRRKAKRGWR